MNTGSISSFEIASSECTENKEEVVTVESDENEEEQCENVDKE